MSHQSNRPGPSLRSVLLLPGSVVLLLLAFAPAAAAVPEGWSNPPEVSALEMLFVLVGAPLALILVIALLTYLPVMVRGEQTSPTDPTAGSEWFGGPRGGTSELAQPDSAESRAGGASARW